jgi:hypothetical protein
MTAQCTPAKGSAGILAVMDGGRWTLEIDGVLLPGANRLIRMHAQDYRKLRDELLLLARSSLTPAAPARPLDRCRVDVELWRPRRSLLDADAKYGAVKPLLDVLQPDRGYARSIGRQRVRDVAPGLGLIRDDRDGEGDLDGCILDLRVRQHVGDPRVEVTVTGLAGEARR